MNDATSSNVKQGGEQSSADRATASASSPEPQPGGLAAELPAAKVWWQSRTLQGTAITVLSLALSKWAASDELARLLEALGTVIGTALTIYGRIKADRPLSAR